MPLVRYKITIQYHGADFLGWQYQPTGMTVQEILEKNLTILHRAPVAVWGSGRTDSGVHARAQCAHFDWDSPLPAHKIMQSFNGMAKPYRVAISHIETTHTQFHARFDAKMRYYTYRLWYSPTPPIFERDFVWHQPHHFSLTAMQTAGQLLLGHHDFSAFRAKNCQAQSPVKTMSGCHITDTGAEILFQFNAKSFLYNQVRNMVGSLVDVGRGRTSVDEFQAIFASCNRALAGQCAPPQGLIFERVEY